MLLGSGMVIGSKAAHSSKSNALAVLPPHLLVAPKNATLAGVGAYGDLASGGGLGSLWPGVMVGAPPLLEEAALMAATNTTSAGRALGAGEGGGAQGAAGADLLELWLGELAKKKKPSPGKKGLTWADAIGLTLALGSAVSLASFMLIIQVCAPGGRGGWVAGRPADRLEGGWVGRPGGLCRQAARSPAKRATSAEHTSSC